MGKYQIPKDVLEEHILVLGKTRKGKSSVMRGAFIEPLLDDNQPVCIIDPKGDHWGLKLAKDGQGPGYPVVIFGGDYADVPINEHSGKQVAELVATGNRPCIIDLGGWMVGKRTRFFNDFAEKLFQLNRGQRWVVIDEVHNFAPQGSTMRNPDRALMVHWANRLASEGLGRGINLIMASQRPQKVHKDLVTSCETLIAMGVIHPLDRDQIKLWIDGCGDPSKGKEVITSLARLKKGEAFVWSPEREYGPKRVQFKLFKTYDSFAPRKAKQKSLKGWASVDLDDVKEKLAAVVAEAEANDPNKLKKRIRELENEIRSAGSADPEELQTLQRGIAERDEEIASLRKGLDQANSLLFHAREGLSNVSHQTRTMSEAINQVTPPSQVQSPMPISQPTEEHRLFNRVKAAPPKSDRDSDPAVLGQAGPHKCMIAIAQYPDGVSRSQLCALTAYAIRSITTYIGHLRQSGLVTEGWPVRATQEGIDALGDDYEPLPTGRALYDHWMSILPTGPGAVLKKLVERHSEGMDRSELVEATDYALRSITTYVGQLKTRRLIEKRGRRFYAVPELQGA